MRSPWATEGEKAPRGAGAAVTVAVLLLAPRSSRDEVHRCSHSVRRFIGRLKQCISVKSGSSSGHFAGTVLRMQQGVEKPSR